MSESDLSKVPVEDEGVSDEIFAQAEKLLYAVNDIRKVRKLGISIRILSWSECLSGPQ